MNIEQIKLDLNANGKTVCYFGRMDSAYVHFVFYRHRLLNKKFSEITSFDGFCLLLISIIYLILNLYLRFFSRDFFQFAMLVGNEIADYRIIRIGDQKMHEFYR